MSLASEKYQWVYMTYWKAKSHPWPIGIGLLLLALAVCTFIFRAALSRYLHGLDPSLLSQMCIGVGAALIGLIAVVFTLSLFVIQQISDRSVPGILREYAADNLIRTIYAALSIMAVGSLLGAILLPREHPVLMFSIAIFGAILSLLLLSILFVRVAYLSDPASIILHVWQSGMHELKRLKVVQDELLRLNPQIKNETDPLGRILDNVGMATAALYDRTPMLTKRLGRSLDHLCSLMRHFSAEQQYNLLDEAAGAVTHILREYIELRASSLSMGNSLYAMMGLRSQWDGLIVASAETFASLMKIAVESGDSQGAQTLAKQLGKLTYQSVGWKPREAPPGENPTAAFLAYYLVGIAKQSVAKKNEDVLLTINQQVFQITGALALNEFWASARLLVDEWSEIATLEILGLQQIAATDTTASLMNLLCASFDPRLAYSGLSKHIRDKVMMLCELEAKLGSKGIGLGATMSASPDTPVRLVLGGVSPSSFAVIHSKLINLLASNYSEEEHEIWSSYAHILEDLDEAMWTRLEKIGLASAAGTESILFYLNQAAYAIAEQLLWLWKALVDKNLPPIDIDSFQTGDERVAAAQRMEWRARFKKDLEKLLDWHVIAFYSRCRTLQPATSADLNLRGCFECAVGIAIQALGVGMTKLALETANMVGNSCAVLIKEGGPAKLIDNCRIASILTDLGLVAVHERSNEVVAAVGASFKKCFGEAESAAAAQPDAFQHWRAPFTLLTERIQQIATGTGRYFDRGARLSVWRPSYSRQEAEEYLEMLIATLNEPPSAVGPVPQ
jgi:hypothetical protein